MAVDQEVDMFCTSCGSRTSEDAKFCAKCGKPIVDLPKVIDDKRPSLPSNAVAQPAPSLPSALPPPSVSQQRTSIPKVTKKPSVGMAYVWLCLAMAGLIGFIGISLFWLARMIVSGSPELTTHRDVGGGVGVLLVAAFGVSRLWTRILVSEPVSEPHFRRKHKRFNLIVGGGAILFSAATIAYGVQRGDCDAVTTRFSEDLKQFEEIAQSIGAARILDQATIDDYIQVYKSIEPKVAQERTSVARLRAEVPHCGELQGNRGHLEFMIDTLGRQMAVLSREIEVARSIGTSPASERGRRWQSELVPLADQEASLARQLKLSPIQ